MLRNKVKSYHKLRLNLKAYVLKYQMLIIQNLLTHLNCLHQLVNREK